MSGSQWPDRDVRIAVAGSIGPGRTRWTENAQVVALSASRSGSQSIRRASPHKRSSE